MATNGTINKVMEHKWKVTTIVALVVGVLGVANTYNVFGGYFWTASAQAVHIHEQAAHDAKQDILVQDVLDQNQLQRDAMTDQMHAIDINLVKLTAQIQEMNRRFDRERRGR